MGAGVDVWPRNMGRHDWKLCPVQISESSRALYSASRCERFDARQHQSADFGRPLSLVVVDLGDYADMAAG